MLYENKQQRSKTIKQVSSRPITNLGLSTSYLAQNNEERQTNILDVHQSTQYRPKDKTYRSPTHTQYIVTHQPTRIHRKRKFQLNRNEPANLIKVTYRPKVLILSQIFLRKVKKQHLVLMKIAFLWQSCYSGNSKLEICQQLSWSDSMVTNANCPTLYKILNPVFTTKEVLTTLYQWNV